MARPHLLEHDPSVVDRFRLGKHAEQRADGIGYISPPAFGYGHLTASLVARKIKRSGAR